MIIIYNFLIDMKEYVLRGKENDFPILSECLQCKAKGQVHRHGFYWRNGITEDKEERVPVCRYKCTACKKTTSLLPDFLIPYFQHTLHTVLTHVNQALNNEDIGKKRQLSEFHLERYIRNLNWIHSWFVEQGSILGFSENKRKEATKYLKMIHDFGESTFLRRTLGHLSSYFMAH
jgi:transposase-like protein